LLRPPPRASKRFSLKIIPASPLADDVAAFLVSKEAEGTSRNTLRIYGKELHSLQAFLGARGVHQTRDLAAIHLRGYLLHLAERRNPGGQHIAYRVIKTFRRW
jgi:site-specific recombinase XerD